MWDTETLEKRLEGIHTYLPMYNTNVPTNPGLRAMRESWVMLDKQDIRVTTAGTRCPVESRDASQNTGEAEGGITYITTLLI